MSDLEIREKSLFEIWSKTLPKLSPNRANVFMNYCGLALGLVPFLFGEIQEFSEVVDKTTTLLAQIYSGLLGFILAGYTIFASVTNPSFMLAMWNYPSSENSNLPLLKVHVLVFMRMFITLFLGVIFCIVFNIGGVLVPHLNERILLHPYLMITCQAIFLSLLGVTVSATGTQLKILIFNIYDLVLTQTQFAKIDKENAEK